MDPSSPSTIAKVSWAFPCYTRCLWLRFTYVTPVPITKLRMETPGQAGEMDHEARYFQLFDEGGVTGRDAGVLRARLEYHGPDTDDDGASSSGGGTLDDGGQITLTVCGAVDLLSDTPPIRDITTYSDWDDVARWLLLLMLYLFLGTSYFTWFFNEHACDNPDGCVHEHPGEEAEDGSVSGVATYPNPAGPFFDALLFDISTATTVGWGHHPVDLSAPGEEQQVIYAVTKVLIAVNIIVGIVVIGLMIGTVGDAFSSFFRMRIHTKIQSAVDRVDDTTPIPLPDVPHVAVALGLFFLAIALGTVVFAHTEDIDFVDAFYLTVVSVSTVGYGDYAPTTNSSKYFAVIYLPLGVAFTGASFALSPPLLFVSCTPTPNHGVSATPRVAVCVHESDDAGVCRRLRDACGLAAGG
jgi:hypothetical protein